MQERVKVRRDRPSALCWAVALMVTMLAVWLITLDAPQKQTIADAATEPRVTREVDFQGVTVHFTDLGAFESEWQARVSAAEYALRGAAGVVREFDGEYRVLGAGYTLETDAKRIAGNLSAQEGVPAGVTALSAPTVSLRITASESDAEAIVNADLVLRSQLAQLNTIALQVDRNEISFASARTLARVAASEIRSAKKRLEEIPGGTGQPVCASLIDQLASLEKDISGVSKAAKAGAELSGQLRCCHVCGMLRMIDFLNSLQRNPG